MNRFGDISAAIQQGERYLFSKLHEGHWNGFPTLAGESDIWVTGFIAAHLQLFAYETEWLQQTQHFLFANRHPSGGWSYSKYVPPDADSTSWCIMALKNCNEFNTSLQLQSKAFLWNHRSHNALSTYHIDSGIDTFIGITDKQLIAGWTAPHPDVTVAAILADPGYPDVAVIIERLLQWQTNEGLLPAYWWRSSFYTVTLLLRAYSVLKLECPSLTKELLKHTLARKQQNDGGFSLNASSAFNPFATGLALEIYCHLSNDDTAAEQCAQVLLEKQKEDGSWQGDDLLRIPAPYILDPETVVEWNVTGGGNSIVNDQQGLFTTAIVCHSLHLWLQKITGSSKN